MDEDQFLWMRGRLKELIITAGGENIAPLPIENNIVAELSDILSYVIGKISNEYFFMNMPGPQNVPSIDFQRHLSESY